MTSLHHNHYLQLFFAGLLAVLGFAPFGAYPLVVLALALLFWRWQHANGRWQALRLGWTFGLGLFSGGIGWLYVALHDYGDMPAALAAPAIGLFAALLALYPALVGYVQSRVRSRLGGHRGLAAPLGLLLVMPALWVLTEWLRGTLFTGFPWLSLGYAQAATSPLAGYAPILGVYGVSLAVAISAGLLAWWWQERVHPARNRAVVALLLLWGGGLFLRQLPWSEPVGEPVTVSLVQGNISQDLKFDEGQLIGTLETYRRLVEGSDARLVVLPETALPLLRSQLPPGYAQRLGEHVRANGGDLLIGAFDKDQGLYYNSVFTLGSADSQSYRKHHLVPFGEFIPLRPVLGWLINDVLHIPMGDLARGDARQQLLQVAGQKVAADICYEDVFGEEIINYLPDATLLVNVTNDAWYGASHAAMQHNQIAQMRALETGRMMLRATNTGVTSVIDRDGHIVKMLPQHEAGVLSAEVQGYAGSTPYVRWGNAAVLGLILLMLLATWRLSKRMPAPAMEEG